MKRSKLKRAHWRSPCPCESGLCYRDCCWDKEFKWMVDSKGRIHRQIPIHPELREYLDAQKRKFIQIYGRKPRGHESIHLSFPSAEYQETQTYKVFLESGIPAEKIYAHLQTGLLPTTENLNLIPDCDLDEWSEAIEEYRTQIDRDNAESDITRMKVLARFYTLENHIKQIITVLERFIHLSGEALNVKLGLDGDHTHHDFLMLCFAKSLKSLKAVQHLLDDCYGEDCLIIVRSIYENYLHIGFLLRHPEKTNDLVTAKVRIRTGDCEIKKRTHESGKKQRVIVDRVTQQIFEANISIRTMAEKGFDCEDVQIHEFLYSFLSDYGHPSIFGLEAYLSGHKFDVYRSDKGFQAMLYACYSGAAILECLQHFKHLSSLHRRDIRYIATSTANSLIEIFNDLECPDSFPNGCAVFQGRLRRLIQRFKAFDSK